MDDETEDGVTTYPIASPTSSGEVSAREKRERLKKYTKDFVRWWLIYGILVSVFLGIPCSRHWFKEFLLHALGGRLPIVCGCLAAAASLVPGFLQEFFLEWEEAAKRAMLSFTVVAFTIISIGLASSYLQDEDHTHKTLESLDKTLKTLTGADSYPVVWPIEAGKDFGRLSIYNAGDYPMYDLSVDVIDLRTAQKFRKVYGPLDHVSLRDENDMPQINIGNLSRRVVRHMTDIKIDRKDIGFEFISVARNGTFYEMLLMHELSRHWAFAFQIQDSSGKVINEHIDRDFPNPPKGPLFPQKYPLITL